MKKRYIVFTVAQAVFCAAVPLAFIFTQYAETSEGLVYKLPLGMLLLVIAILIIAKNTLLKPRIAKLTAQIAQHEADLKVESDEGRINNLVSELKRERTASVVINAIMPLIVLAAFFVACKAMESAVMELSGAVGFSLASFALGTVFGILAARTVYTRRKK